MDDEEVTSICMQGCNEKYGKDGKIKLRKGWENK